MRAQQEPAGIGVHPAKLAFGYLAAARATGATVRPASPVTEITQEGDRYARRDAHQ